VQPNPDPVSGILQRGHGSLNIASPNVATRVIASRDIASRGIAILNIASLASSGDAPGWR
jgi:hypothetical protein